MEWTDSAIVLSSRPHGETATILDVMTRQNGRHLGLVRGGAGLPGSKLEPMLRSQPLDSAIATIPYSVIASFLDRPSVISKDEVKRAPYVLALRGEHDIAGEGDELYVKKLDAQTTGARYAVMHVEEPLDDPEGDRKLGYLAIYAGTAQLTLLDTDLQDDLEVRFFVDYSVTNTTAARSTSPT